MSLIKKKKKYVTGNVTETRNNGNVITEMPDGNAIVRFKRGNELRPWKTRSLCFCKVET